MSAAKAGRAPVDKTTGRVLAIDKGETHRHFDKKTRQEAKERLGGMRKAVRGARQEGVDRLKAVTEQCRENLQKAQRAYEEAKAKLDDARGGKKTARSTCATNKRATREETKGRVHAAKERRDEEAAQQRRDRARTRAQARIKDPSAPSRKRSALKEQREESDDAVVQNLSPELVPLWNREKDRFKGPPHRRYEEFLEHVEANPADVLDAREEQAGIARERAFDQELAAAQAQHYGFALEAQSAPRSRGGRKKSAAERTKAMFGPDVMHQRGRHSPGLAPPPPLRLSHSPNGEDDERGPRHAAHTSDFPF